MKRFLLITISIIFSCFCAAQEKKERFFAPVIEISGGPRFAVYPKDEVLAKPLSMYQAGALLGVEMNLPHGAVFLKTGALFENYRYTWGEVQHITASFIDVPILFGYRYRFSDRFSASASVGMGILFCYHYKNNGLDIAGREMDHNHVTGASADLSAEYALSSWFSICAAVMANHYFRSTLWVKYDNNYQSMELPTFIGIRLGVRFRL